jgi:hypothetical protein
MPASSYHKVRQPAVAGQFYPGDPGRLSANINAYLEKASTTSTPEPIRGILVPHAGYDYSGPVAAYAYNQIRGQHYETVVLICNSHTAYFNGAVIDDADGWETPLGVVPVNRELAAKLISADSELSYNSEAHAADHTLEVQLPFLQVALKGDFQIVPILFGNTSDESYKKLAQVLFDNLGEDDLVVVSTDMSHYPDYDDANRIDRTTLEKIAALDMAGLDRHISDTEAAEVSSEDTLLCGIDGAKTAMALARLADWQPVILHYANSGDTPEIGDKARVVGYGAMAFGQVPSAKFRVQNDEKILNNEQKKALLAIARQTAEKYVREGKVAEFDISDERLEWKEGAFVTLTKGGQLRGCIGQIIPTEKPLWQVVRDMAIAAATEDPRFAPVSKRELPEIEYEISVLSRPEKIEDWRQIELGQHGVIVKSGYHSGVFLPQVATETGWDRETFLAELCSQKAGLPANCYKSKDVTLEVFTAQVFSQEISS